MWKTSNSNTATEMQILVLGLEIDGAFPLAGIEMKKKQESDENWKGESNWKSNISQVLRFGIKTISAL